MMRKSFFLLIFGALFMLFPSDCKAQLTINIRYSAENGNAKKYVEEMEKSGIADKIRNIVLVDDTERCLVAVPDGINLMTTQSTMEVQFSIGIDITDGNRVGIAVVTQQC